MKQKLKTSLAFAKNLFETGAISETSRDVEIQICKHIPDVPNAILVEYGMGHGNITREILSRMPQDATLYAFEVNKEFCEHVEATIKDDRLKVICDGAETVKNYVDRVDAIYGTIPYSFFSKDKAMGIIRDSYELLPPGGYYTQALYTKFNFKKFTKVFDDCELVEVNSFPPEYMYYCRKKA